MHLMLFNPVRRAINQVRVLIWNRVWGMSIHPSAQISLSAKLDKTNPRGIIIGKRVVVTFGTTILAHDMSRRLRTTTTIHDDTFLGAHSIIMPGVSVGPRALVAAGSVVTRDVPPDTIVGGNPARIIKSHAGIASYGRLASALPPEALTADH
jgi:acetyltransferase-like isoleucine patch superfamily enzyme